MIITSPPQIRPCFYHDKNWVRKDIKISSDGHSINASGLLVSEDQLTDLTADIGMVCYAAVIGDRLTVFDFSSSHLCPKQLLRIQMLCRC